MRSIHVFVLVVALLMRSVFAEAKNIIQPYEPYHEGVISNVFSVKANGKAIAVTNYKGIHFLRFGQQGTANVEIQLLQPVTDIQVSPRHTLISDRNLIKINLDKPGYYVLSAGNGERLFLLADSISSLAGIATKSIVTAASYGADNTGKTLCTQQLQKAINETAARRQVLLFEKGIYKTGTLKIASHANIYLEENAVIKGSADTADYPMETAFLQKNEQSSNIAYPYNNGGQLTCSRLLLIDNASNVRISGRGIINGTGKIIRGQHKEANIFRIRNSKDVTIEGVCLFDPASWDMHILHSDSVLVKNVKLIHDMAVENTDGIDPDASSNVLIKDCFAYCSDDNVAIKTTGYDDLLRSSENITVEGCVFLTKKSALKVGTETRGQIMKNIVFKNNYIVQADRGLVLYCFDGASFENIKFIGNYFEKGFADNERKAIHFYIMNRRGAGSIKNVLVEDCEFSSSFFKDCKLSGLDKDHIISNVLFRNITLNGKQCYSLADLNLNTNEYVTNLEYKN